MRPKRLLLRSLWLALPVTLALLALVVLANIAARPALLAWMLGLVLSGALAWLRERRLEATGRYLEALAEGREPEPLPEFGPLGGDELATALHRLDRNLAEQRERRAETDRLLATLLDALPDPLLLVGGDRTVVGANKAAVALFGHQPVTRPIEASLRDPGLLAAVDEALEDHGEAQLTIQLPGPPSRAFGVLVVPVRLRRQAAALVGLRELTAQLMIERMRSDFVANASHELRTPLTALRGFIDTLVGPARDDPEARERFLETMAAETARMSRLVDDLLSLSRIEQSEHQPPSLRVDLVDCLRSVVRSLRGYADERNATLDLQLVEPLPAVIADRDQLVQLLTNLIDNAIKYGGSAGEVTIRAEHVRAAPPGAGPLTGRSAVRVVVSDRGPGIAREHLPRVTERFFRVDPGRSRQLGGTGLGLAIVKHILRRHRGHLLIESELGQGTTVTVYLPAPEHAAGAR
ncbi:MAG: two-component sensor histidine kinase [Geminicoccaceae bacterium]|nr:two-component sensor histidine kinase [Geminicoccaceae bacterium]